MGSPEIPPELTRVNGAACLISEFNGVRLG
jgi:hypothetical protein